ncbi:MAG: glycoside hydrolase family 127 protein [Ruminococcaceae bacterium]|nr:glycoside hydrolase family 127 protein [Oscillospiraceae bacterium]
MIEKVPFSDVEITGGFWKKRQDLNRSTTIHAVRDRFAETGRFDAFRCDWKEGDPNHPHIYWDSDVAKWIEAVAYLIEKQPEPALEAVVEGVIDQIEKNQWDDGYFNICFSQFEPQNRFTRRTDHELYCAGHLIEAAIAWYRATGRPRFLQCMCRYADLIERVFAIEKSAAFVTPGHEEIELALVKLYEVTGDERYLKLSQFFVEMRGTTEEPDYSDYNAAQTQSHLPVREQKTAEGHAVRAMYLYSAMADLARHTGDESLRAACETLFQNITGRRMYITGGTGSSAIGEAFTYDFDLPNYTAYAETCAAIGLAFFASRMQLLANDARYADTVERVLYNGILSGISLDGTAFFYENPLAVDPRMHARHTSVPHGRRERLPIMERQKMFSCSCCPPNLTRFFASLGDLLYTKDESTVYCHQFMASTASFDHLNETVTIEQITDYPRNGEVTLRYSGPATRLAVRVPYWCRNSWQGELENGYAVYDVADGSEVRVSFDVRPRTEAAHPYVVENAGRVAVLRGPVVYCIEGFDNGTNLREVALDAAPAFIECENDEFGTILYANAFIRRPVRELYGAKRTKEEFFIARMIPYHTFANRGPTEMLVWLMQRDSRDFAFLG